MAHNRDIYYDNGIVVCRCGQVHALKEQYPQLFQPQPASTPPSPITLSQLFEVADKLQDLHLAVAALQNQIGTLLSGYYRPAQTETDGPTTGRVGMQATPEMKLKLDSTEAASSDQPPVPSSPASTPRAAPGARMQDGLQAPFSWAEYALTLTALGFRPTREAYSKYLNLAKRLQDSHSSRKDTTGKGKASSSKQKAKTARSRRSN